MDLDNCGIFKFLTWRVVRPKRKPTFPICPERVDRYRCMSKWKLCESDWRCSSWRKKRKNLYARSGAGVQASCIILMITENTDTANHHISIQGVDSKKTQSCQFRHFVISRKTQSCQFKHFVSSKRTQSCQFKHFAISKKTQSCQFKHFVNSKKTQSCQFKHFVISKKHTVLPI